MDHYYPVYAHDPYVHEHYSLKSLSKYPNTQVNVFLRLFQLFNSFKVYVNFQTLILISS